MFLLIILLVFEIVTHSHSHGVGTLYKIQFPNKTKMDVIHQSMARSGKEIQEEIKTFKQCKAGTTSRQNVGCAMCGLTLNLLILDSPDQKACMIPIQSNLSTFDLKQDCLLGAETCHPTDEINYPIVMCQHPKSIAITEKIPVVETNNFCRIGERFMKSCKTSHKSSALLFWMEYYSKIYFLDNFTLSIGMDPTKLDSYECIGSCSNDDCINHLCSGNDQFCENFGCKEDSLCNCHPKLEISATMVKTINGIIYPRCWGLVRMEVEIEGRLNRTIHPLLLYKRHNDFLCPKISKCVLGEFHVFRVDEDVKVITGVVNRMHFKISDFDHKDVVINLPNEFLFSSSFVQLDFWNKTMKIGSCGVRCSVNPECHPGVSHYNNHYLISKHCWGFSWSIAVHISLLTTYLSAFLIIMYISDLVLYNFISINNGKPIWNIIKLSLNYLLFYICCTCCLLCKKMKIQKNEKNQKFLKISSFRTNINLQLKTIKENWNSFEETVINDTDMIEMQHMLPALDYSVSKHNEQKKQDKKKKKKKVTFSKGNSKIMVVEPISRSNESVNSMKDSYEDFSKIDESQKDFIQASNKRWMSQLAGSSLFLVCLINTLSLVYSCTNPIILHSDALICNETINGHECKMSSQIRITLTSIGSDSCIIVKPDKGNYATIKFSADSVTLVCEKRISYYTFFPTVSCHKMVYCPASTQGVCPLTGCPADFSHLPLDTLMIDNKTMYDIECRNYEPKVTDLCLLENFGHGCEYRFGFLSNNKHNSFPIYTCNSWKLHISVTGTVMGLHDTSIYKKKINLITGESKDFYRSSLTIAHYELPPLLKSVDCYFHYENETYMTECNKLNDVESYNIGQIQCSSLVLAQKASSQCKFSKEIIKFDDSGNCRMKVKQISDLPNNCRIPIISPDYYMYTFNDSLLMEMRKFINVELHFIMRDSFVSIKMELPDCTFRKMRFDGCYNCDAGVHAEITLSVERVFGVVHLDCPDLLLDVPILTKNATSIYNFIFYSDRKNIDTLCYLQCQNKVVIHLKGVLREPGIIIQGKETTLIHGVDISIGGPLEALQKSLSILLPVNFFQTIGLYLLIMVIILVVLKIIKVLF